MDRGAGRSARWGCRNHSPLVRSGQGRRGSASLRALVTTNQTDTGTPRPGRHLAVAVAVGVAAAAYVALVYGLQPANAAPDFDLWYVAAQAWRLGLDPYAVVSQQGWRWPLYYPGTMVVAIAPVAGLPLVAARAIVLGLGSGLLAYAIQASGRSLWLLASGAFLATLYHGQAGAWLTAAAVLPWLGFVLTCKPTVGLAIGLVYGWRWPTVVSAILFLALSLLLFPEWPSRWHEAVRVAPDVVAPITRPGGVLVLAALFRWRHRDAWLLLALACVPHTTLIHETLPLALIPRGTRESQAYAGATLAAVVAGYGVPFTTWSADLAWIWPIVFLLGYVPPLLMLLRRPVRGRR